MDIEQYLIDFKVQASVAGYSDDEISLMSDYVKNLKGKNLPVIFDQEHLASLLGYQYEYLLSVSNDPLGHYVEYDIPKKNGKIRHLEEPFPSLKDIQTWILKNILNPAAKTMVSPAAKAFVKKKSLRDNARFHRNKRTVLALDIRDFFESVRATTVFCLFRDMGYDGTVAKMLERLCTNKNHLPQGAPTSPMLSNLVFKRLDDFLLNYCQKRSLQYTRYADDLTISGDRLNVKRVISYVKMLLKAHHFELNEDKTKVMGRGMRQDVTGVVVNTKMQTERKYRKTIRQEMYFAIKYGLAESLTCRKHVADWIITPEQYAKHLYGKICFVLQINPYDKEFVAYRDWLKERALY